MILAIHCPGADRTKQVASVLLSRRAAWSTRLPQACADFCKHFIPFFASTSSLMTTARAPGSRGNSCQRLIVQTPFKQSAPLWASALAAQNAAILERIPPFSFQILAKSYVQNSLPVMSSNRLMLWWLNPLST